MPGPGTSATPPIRAVFVLSSWHSGSTWVGYVLGSTPQSAYLGEFFRAWDDTARVPCTLCAGRGLLECEVLHGIEARPPQEAFATIAARTGRRVLVESSKLIDWAARFVSSKDLDLRFVHVVKDPRGWFASARRRGNGDLATAMEFWCAENRAFLDFMKGSGKPAISVCYDILARSPRKGFTRLFAFCGLTFTDAALDYWNTEHHGFAANGASDSMIKAANIQDAPSHFATGDDAFYKRNSNQHFHDDRWRTALSPDEQQAIRSHTGVKSLLARLGLRLSPTGIEPDSWWGRLLRAR